MELVVLNIGYDLGVLSPSIFAMMVIMALITTFMTGPALDLINLIFKSKYETEEKPREKIGKYKILISFVKPENSPGLLKIGNSLIKRMNGNASVTAAYISPTNELHHYSIEQYEKESLLPVMQEAQNLNQTITTLFKISTDIDIELVEIANKVDFDLLLIDPGRSIFEGSLLGKMLGFTTRIVNPEKLLKTVTGKEKFFDSPLFDDRTLNILSKSQIPVGILLERELKKIDQIFIPVFGPKDVNLINLAIRLIKNNSSLIYILDPSNLIEKNKEVLENLKSIENSFTNNISIQHQFVPDETFIHRQDLMIISLDSWKNLLQSKNLWLSDVAATLIMYE
jgi:hypothetical protein